MNKIKIVFQKILNSKMKKIVSVSLQSTLFVLLLLTVCTFVSSRTLLFNVFRSMVVLTGSMEPVLPVGSVVYIQKQIAYDKGSIITFQNTEGKNVTHRIADIAFTDKGTVYRTKGDANQKEDASVVPSDKVTGKVIFSLPYVGNIIHFLNQPQGFISFVIFPAFLLIVIELWNIKKELEKQIEKKLLNKLNQTIQ